MSDIDISYVHEDNEATLSIFGTAINPGRIVSIANANGIFGVGTHFTLAWQSGSKLIAFGILYEVSGNIKIAEKGFALFAESFIPNTQQGDLTVNISSNDVVEWIRSNASRNN